MNIREQEDKLFCEWEDFSKNKKKRKGFIRDGVVSESDYLKSALKIVFVLKEANDRDKNDWDLRYYLKTGAEGGGKTWNNVARWVYGIRNRTSMPNWKEFPAVDDTFRAEKLKNICAMNLKKNPGVDSTNYEELEAVTTEDRAYIQKQYAFYNPDITICGGGQTGCLFKNVVLGDQDKVWEKTTQHFWWYETSANKYVVSAPHPRAYIETEELFRQFRETVNNIYPC